jgi:aryl-alcohol dehydrogenase-like predicted oxidoreductase
VDYRKLGESDLEVTVVTLGAWAIGGSMWGGTDEAKAIDAIRASVDLGVTSIDTAAIYGYGRSEEIVGQAIRDLPRDRLQILTKYGLRWDAQEGEHFFDLTEPDGREMSVWRNARKESVMHECEQSLRRLGVDHIDLYQCHWRDHTVPVDEPMEAMQRLIEQGKVRAAGVSNFTVEELDRCRQLVPVVSHQPPYSMLKRDIEADLLPYCREHDVGVVVYSPLQKGLLTGKMTPDHEFAPGDHRATDPDFEADSIRRVNAFLDRIRPLAEAHGATLAQLVIGWTIRQPGVTAALVGARDAAQAEQNARAGELELSDDTLAVIDRELEELRSPR